MLYYGSNLLGELGIPQAPHGEVNVDRKISRGGISLCVFSPLIMILTGSKIKEDPGGEEGGKVKEQNGIQLQQFHCLP